jgi:hypothetical protein
VVLVSAVGYLDTAVNIGNLTELSITLSPTAQSLREAVVSGPVPAGSAKIMETIDRQAIANTVSEYRESQNLFTGQSEVSAVDPVTHSVTTVISTRPTGTVYTGAFLPVFTHKEETRGSRYFFDKWVSGAVMDTAGNVYKKSSYLFNYDKISKSLLLTEDQQSVISIDRDRIRKFTLRDENANNYVFEKIPALSQDNLYLELVIHPTRYSLYKLVKTRFVKSDYHTDGIVESGNPYDEYLDEPEYYITLNVGRDFKIINFKKKFIKEVLSAESAKLQQYFSDHIDETITEKFLVGLINYLNE